MLNSFYGVEIRWLKKKFPFMIKPFSLLINKSDAVTAISTHTADELRGIVKIPIDIITFSAAMAERQGLARMNRAILRTLDELATNACARAGIEPQAITDVVLVGNSVMHHLLLGIDPAPTCGASGVLPAVLFFLQGQSGTADAYRGCASGWNKFASH